MTPQPHCPSPLSIILPNKWCLLISFVFLCEQVVSAQTITTFAGNGLASGINGDGGPATNAILNAANGGCFDTQGNYYVSEIHGHRVRKVTPDGIISTIAGTGFAGSSGNGGPATLAQLKNPSDIIIDKSDNLFIADGSNYRIQRVDAATGIVITFAGTGTYGYNGDNIPATTAQLQGITQLCFDNYGNLLFCDYAAFRVRKVNTAGVISTIAGGGFSSTGTGDGGPATNATFNLITGIAVDRYDNIYVADYNAGQIRRITTDGMIHSFAGTGSLSYAGDNMPASSSSFAPTLLRFDNAHQLIIADKYNRRILKIDDSGIIHCIAGNGATGYSGDGGPATAAALDFPAGLAYDTCGNLYVAESTNRRVRKIALNPECLPISVPPITTDDVPLSIYPNPATSQLSISYGAGLQSVTITDMLARTVMYQTFTGQHSAELPLHLSPGCYLIAINHLPPQKLIIQ